MIINNKNPCVVVFLGDSQKYLLEKNDLDIISMVRYVNMSCKIHKCF